MVKPLRMPPSWSLDEKRIPVRHGVHFEHCFARETEQHEAADEREEAGIEHRSRPDQPEGNAVTVFLRLEIAKCIVGDQLCGPADLRHDLIASVDAERALDAFELRAIADIDARRADRHALPAIDAIAAPFPGFVLLVGTARFAAEAAIGDEEGVGVEHRALDARPGAHIGAELFA